MPVPQNAQLIWDYLISQGLSANAAAGILGNIEQESGGSPTAGVWPNNYGMIQWTPASEYFSSPPDLQAQLPAIIRYIQENGSIADVNAHAANPSAAALYFSERYERPLASEANNANRMNSANDVAQAAQSGHWPGSGPSSPPGSWLCAFQDNQGQLWLCNSNRQNNETGLAMAAGTPSLVSP
jgi:Phage tail lysozyme